MTALAVGIAFGASATSGAAEELDLTGCFFGNLTVFFEVKEAKRLSSYSGNGITYSTTDKRLEDAVYHCEGVGRGSGADYTDYGLCKLVDTDGDTIIYGASDSAGSGELKLLEGTGKWKGITGSFHTERVVGSKPGKGAMPGTFQGCRRWKGAFELPK